MLHAIDYGVLLLMLACVGLIGLFFASGTTSDGLFSARKGVGWLPAALSVASAIIGSGRIAEIVGASYDYGWKCLAAVAGLFLATLLVWWLAHPLLNRVESGSLFEYLELRFDRRLRAVAAALALVALFASLVSMLASAAGWIAALGFGFHPTIIVVAVALLAVLLASLGGLRAIVWSDVMLLVIVVAGGGITIAAAVHQTNGGAAAIWQTSIDLDRRAILDLNWNPAESWNIWLALPGWTVAWCAWLVTRPDIHQRWAATGDAAAARYAILGEGLLGCGLIAGLIYAGIALLAFYQQEPERIRPIWAANIFPENGKAFTRPETRQAPLLDPQTGKQRVEVSREVIRDESGNPVVDPQTGQPREKVSRTVQLDPTDGVPLLDFYADDLSPETLPEIVAQRRLLQPNTQKPFISTERLLDSSGKTIQVNEFLVRRGAIASLKRPEAAMLAAARPQLAPYFASHHVPWGVQGLMTAGFIGGLMVAMAAGLNAIGLILDVDFYRSLGLGRSFVASWHRKSVEELTPGDEMSPLRWIVAGIGIAIAVAALAVGVGDAWLSLAGSVAGLTGGPLFAVFLLGLFTRQATSLATLAGLIVGLLVAAWWMLKLPPFAGMSDAGGVIAGAVTTLMIGAVLSFFVGEPRETREIRGLVVTFEQSDLYLPEKLPIAEPTAAPKIGPPKGK